MANLINSGENKRLVDQLDHLRTSICLLLREMDQRSRPVQEDPENGVDFYEAVARFEAQLIESALVAAGGRQNRAAGLLRMKKSTLNTKMKQLNLR